MSKKDFLLIIAGLILTIILFIPSRGRASSCPKGKTTNPVLGGACSSFVDQNKNLICDRLENLNIPSINTFNFSLWPYLIALIALTGAAIFLLTNRKLKNKGRWRWAILTVSSLIFYFVFPKICPLATLQALFFQKENIVYQITPFLFFLLPLLIAPIWGRIFCGFLCPIGFIQEIIFSLREKLGIKKNFSLPSFLNFLPLLILILTAAFSLVQHRLTFCSLDPFSVFFERKINIPLSALLATVLAVSFFVFRPFCRLICPYGAVISLLSRFSIFGLGANRKKCSQCHLCQKICPTKAIKDGKVNTQNCFSCFRCQKNCPQKAISYQQISNPPTNKIQTRKNS